MNPQSILLTFFPSVYILVIETREPIGALGHSPENECFEGEDLMEQLLHALKKLSKIEENESMQSRKNVKIRKTH